MGREGGSRNSLIPEASAGYSRGKLAMTPKELVEDSWLPALVHASRASSSVKRGSSIQDRGHRARKGPSLCLRAPLGLLAQNCSSGDCPTKRATLPRHFMIELKVTESVRQEQRSFRIAGAGQRSSTLSAYTMA
ncbi:hypothetical protein QQF64_002562 [Cirrhinus molitorella]|uniref:Uncharacterized protein n=1 Tax=Cirrhinus molitorella TaxID=172907 RepID=A0ABR3MQK3_9TELE